MDFGREPIAKENAPAMPHPVSPRRKILSSLVDKRENNFWQ
jgi:hypothetical protein